MNSWMMAGDWGAMPMNRRGPVIQNPYPVVPPISDEVVDQCIAVADGHYDIAVMDDVVSADVPLGDFVQECLGLPPPSWVQKQLMEALERSKGRPWKLLVTNSG